MDGTHSSAKTSLLCSGPSWGSTRHGYSYSAELLARLTPNHRRELHPIGPRYPGGPSRAADAHDVDG